MEPFGWRLMWQKLINTMVVLDIASKNNLRLGYWISSTSFLSFHTSLPGMNWIIEHFKILIHIPKSINGKTKLEASPPKWSKRLNPKSQMGPQLLHHLRLSLLLRWLCRYSSNKIDSNYMNDLWTFNTITMEWKEVQTSGDIPSHRSNCSMSYDRNNNRVIVFGGGGANKRRFNTISILDWKTKEWMEINPKPNESAPWERTYHTAELFYPYLVVFGG